MTSSIGPGVVLQDRYKIIGVLDQGGSGVLYLASRLGIPDTVHVVIKEVDPDLAGVDQFQNEVRMLFHLSHPGLPKIYDFFADADKYYLAMEHVEGRPLDAIVESLGTGIPVENVVNYALQIGGILAYLHSQKVLHLDLKPGNLMISPQGRVKLIDFGIARPIADVPINDDVSYSESVASPEQLEDGVLDERSDIYSFGMTLYYMTVGEYPNRALAGVPFQLGRTIKRLTTKAPWGLESIARRCLQKAPEDRYQSFSAITTDLERFSSEAGLGSIRRPRRRWLRPALLIAFLALAIGVWQWRAYLTRIAQPLTPTVTLPRTISIESPPNGQIIFPVGSSAAEVLFKFVDVQRPDRVIRVATGNPAALIPPGPGIYNITATADGKVVAEQPGVVAFPEIDVDAKVVIGNRVTVLVNLGKDIADRTFSFEWRIITPTGKEIRQTTTKPNLEFEFTEEGAYQFNLQTTIMLPGAQPVVVSTPTKGIEAARALIVDVDRILNPNSGFERIGELGPRDWVLGEKGVTLDTKTVHSGQYSVRLSGPADQLQTYAWQKIQLQPGKQYRLSAWVSGKNVAGGSEILEARFRSRTSDSFVATETHAQQYWLGTWDWRQLVLEFTAPNVSCNLELYLRFHGSGTIWYDDVVLEQVTDH